MLFQQLMRERIDDAVLMPPHPHLLGDFLYCADLHASLSSAIIYCARRTIYLCIAADSAAGLSPNVQEWNTWKKQLDFLMWQANAVQEMASQLLRGIGRDARSINTFVGRAVSVGQY